MGFGLFGSTFIIPLYTQTLLGWTGQQSGLLQLPSTLFVAVMMPVVAQLIQRGVPQKYLIAIGMSIFFIYSYLSYGILTPDTSAGDFFWVLIIRGFGLGLLSVPVDNHLPAFTFGRLATHMSFLYFRHAVIFCPPFIITLLPGNAV